MKNIAVYYPDQPLHIYEQDKIISCEKKIYETETISNKTKAAVVTWNTTGVTKGQILKNFSHAELSTACQ